jgi:hypothetical protein
MPKQKKPKKETKPKPKFECNIIQMIRETKKDTTKTQLRIVEWVVDGRPTGHKLEKRQTYTTSQGKELTGKNVGLTKDDMNFLWANWSDIDLVFI